MELETKHYVAIVVVVLIIIIAVTLGLVFGLPGSDSTDKKLSDTVALKVVDAQGNEKIITPVANDIKQTAPASPTDSSAATPLVSTTTTDVVFTPALPSTTPVVSVPAEPVPVLPSIDVVTKPSLGTPGQAPPNGPTSSKPLGGTPGKAPPNGPTFSKPLGGTPGKAPPNGPTTSKPLGGTPGKAPPNGPKLPGFLSTLLGDKTPTTSKPLGGTPGKAPPGAPAIPKIPSTAVAPPKHSGPAPVMLGGPHIVPGGPKQFAPTVAVPKPSVPGPKMPLVSVKPVTSSYKLIPAGPVDSCASGLTKIGDKCYTAKTICPSGSSFRDGKCYESCPGKTVYVAGSCYTNASKCPEGSVLSNGKCLKCGKGEILNGVMCTYPPRCPTGTVLKAGKCLSECPKGFAPTSDGKCMQQCPPEWTNFGNTCVKPTKYRRDGYTTEKDCLAKSSAGCDKVGGKFYPKCKHGFSANGCCECNGDCIAAGLGIPVGNTACQKKLIVPTSTNPSTTNTATVVPQETPKIPKSYNPATASAMTECSSGVKYNGACYKKCDPGFTANLTNGTCVKSTEYMSNGGILSIFSKNSSAEHFTITEHFVIPPGVQKIFAITRDGSTIKLF